MNYKTIKKFIDDIENVEIREPLDAFLLKEKIDALDLFLMKEYGWITSWFQPSILPIHNYFSSFLPNKDVRYKEKSNKEYANFYKSIKEQIIAFERKFNNDPKFDDKALENTKPDLYHEIEINDEEYWLDKLKENDPYEYSIKRYGYDHGDYFRGRIPNKEGGGRYVKFHYFIGAVWSNIIKGKDGTIHWINISLLINHFSYKPKSSSDKDSFLNKLLPDCEIDPCDLKTHSSRIKKKYGNLIDRLTLKLVNTVMKLNPKSDPIDVLEKFIS